MTNMRPTKWWRTITTDGEVWAESSNEAEIRRIHSKLEGGTLQQLYEEYKTEWRTVTPDEET